jgi:hypothetical protein
MLQCGGHRLVHTLPIAALDEIRGVTVTNEQGFQLVVANAGEED